jgi:predicted permease
MRFAGAEMKSEIAAMVGQIGTLFFYMLVGFASKKFKVISVEGEKSLSSFIINITAPALIISAFLGEYDKTVFNNLWMIGAATTILYIALSFLTLPAAKIINRGEEERADIPVTRFLLLFGNTGFLGIPIAYAIFGSVGVLYTTVFNFINDIFFWTLGIAFMQNTSMRSVLKQLRKLINLPLISISVGAILLFADVKFPKLLVSAINSLGQCTVPLSLIIVGCTAATILENKYFPIAQLARLGAFKLVVLPVIMSIGVCFIPGLDAAAKGTMIMLFSTPCSTSSVAIAKQYGNNHRLAASSVLFTTIACMLTLPLIYSIFN